jgi:hypothetical protein
MTVCFAISGGRYQNRITAATAILDGWETCREFPFKVWKNTLAALE